MSGRVTNADDLSAKEKRDVQDLYKKLIAEPDPQKRKAIWDSANYFLKSAFNYSHSWKKFPEYNPGNSIKNW